MKTIIAMFFVLSTGALSQSGSLTIEFNNKHIESIPNWTIMNLQFITCKEGAVSAMKLVSNDGTQRLIPLYEIAQLSVVPCEITTGVYDDRAAGRYPTDVEIKSVFPNPFIGSTDILFETHKSGEAQVAVYNLYGQKIKTLWNSYSSAGLYTVTWTGENEVNRRANSGVYYVVVSNSESRSVRRVVYLK